MGFGFQAKKTMHDLHVWDGQNGKAYEENEQPYATKGNNKSKEWYSQMES